MKKVLMCVVILGSVLSYADATMSEEEFYDTDVGQTVERMEERHKRIVVLDETITQQINEFHELYNKAKGYTKNSDCSMLDIAVDILNNKVDMYQVDEGNTSKIDLSGLKEMISNLKSKQNTMCKGK